MSTSSPLVALSAAAAAAAPQAPPAWLQFLPLVAMGVIFWFLIIRPQMRRQKEHAAKVAGLQKGDQVVTAGGLIGKVLKVEENTVDLELAPNVKVKAVKSTIGDVVPPGSAKPAND
jgi:preprotein translocase subunit YajC